MRGKLLPWMPHQDAQWRAVVGGPIVSAPAVGTATSITSQDGRIYCARIKHQAVIWNYDSKSQIETSLVEEGRVVFGNIMGWVTSLDALTGSLVWKYKANGVRLLIPGRFSGRYSSAPTATSSYASTVRQGSVV